MLIGKLLVLLLINAGAPLLLPWWPFCIWGVVPTDFGIGCTSTNNWQTGWNMAFESISPVVRRSYTLSKGLY